MGEARTIVCPCCDYTMSISVGIGFISCPGNKTIGKEILDGRYGYRPKQILEENPESMFFSYSALFHCSCGNYSSKGAVRIFAGRKSLYKPSRRCNLCHKKMWEVEELPYDPPCPKCGSRMNTEDYILWD